MSYKCNNRAVLTLLCADSYLGDDSDPCRTWRCCSPRPSCRSPGSAPSPRTPRLMKRASSQSPPLAVPTAEAGRQWRQGRTGPTELSGGNTDRTLETGSETKGLSVFIHGLGFTNGPKPRWRPVLAGSFRGVLWCGDATPDESTGS